MPHKKRDDIQGLRAVAILMVLLFHFYPSDFPNGYVGVDMFFVVSGYIIVMVFPKEWSRVTITNFYYRRVKRILPLYFSVIFVVLVAITLFAPDHFVQVNMDSGQRAVLLISNIMSAHSAELGYAKLIAKADDLFTHCWSLCLELQWYFLAPAICFFSTFRLPVCQIVFILSSFYYCTAYEDVAFNSVFARLWQFTAGIIAHDSIRIEDDEITEDKGIPPFSDKVSRAHFLISMVLSNINAAVLLLGFLPFVLHPSVLRALVTVATAALLLSGSVVNVPLLSTPLFSLLGNISYSLYLVHWPIYITAKNMPFSLSLTIGLCLSVVQATFLYKYFELNYLSWRKTPILVLVVFMFGASLSLTFSGTKIRAMFHRELSLLEKVIMEENEKMPWLAENMAEGGLRNSTNNLGSPLCKYQQLFGIPTNPPLGHCQMPNGKGTQNILVLGNSWAVNQGPSLVYDAFKHIAKEFNVYGLQGCEPLHTSPFCKQWYNYGKQAVEYFKPDILFLMQRVMTANDNITSPVIDNDPLFLEFLDHLRFYETIAKKIYIQQALPSCKGLCTSKVVHRMRFEEKNLTEIGDQFVLRDQDYSRIRIEELAHRCKNCALIDFLPYYPLATNGLPVPYDLDRNVVLLDDQEQSLTSTVPPDTFEYVLRNPSGVGRTGIYLRDIFRAKDNELQMFFLKDWRNTEVSVEMKINNSWLPFSFHCYYPTCGGRYTACGFLDYFAQLEIPHGFEDEMAVVRVNISHKEYRLKILDVRSNGTYAHELAVVLHPAYYVSDWQQVVQYFESWIAHGATKFYIYHYSWSKKVQQVIDFYQVKLGNGLEVLPWSAVPTFPNDRGVFEKDPNTLMFNLVAEAALNNALYRSRNVAKYLAVMDLDEVAFSPRGPLLEILEDIQEYRDFVGSFRIDWVQYTSTVNLVMHDKPSDVNFNYLNLIEKVSNETLTSGYFQSYKCIHRPDRTRLINFHNMIHLEWKNQSAGEPYKVYNMRKTDLVSVHLRRIFDSNKVVKIVDKSGILVEHAELLEKGYHERINGSLFKDKTMSPWLEHHASTLSALHDCRRSHDPEFRNVNFALKKCRSVRACEPYLYDSSAFVMADMSWTNIAEPYHVIGYAT